MFVRERLIQTPPEGYLLLFFNAAVEEFTVF